jgi:chondroitin 4-sulfotransferase 11
MVSHDNKFIFVHINCCAGTSLENALKDWGDWHPNDRPGVLPAFSQHSLIGEYFAAYPKAEDYFTFAIVRNPWARMATYYATHEAYHNMEFGEWVERLGVHDEEKTLYDHARMYSSCASWICLKDQIAVDYVGRFEQLGSAFNTVIQKLGIDASLPHLNQSGRKHYAEFYDRASQEIIAKRFCKDIELFGYEFGD